MARHLRQLLFLLFFISGFCGLLYQVIWVRLAFASFGIITPVLSIVISVFMLGLALGSWGGGAVIATLTGRAGLSAVFFYGITELLIAVGALAVPAAFAAGETILLRAGESDSFAYLFVSALIIAVSVLPWCIFMGATFPFMMAFVRESQSDRQSFSFLYVANVIGAMTGTLMTAAVLIELFGFRATLWIAGCLNTLIATVSFLLAFRQRRLQPSGLGDASSLQESRQPARAFSGHPKEPGDDSSSQRHVTKSAKGDTCRNQSLKYRILFMTGFTSLALEVVWTRAFTPVMGTQVYAFALLLFVYLLATWTGSLLYRRLKRGLSNGQLMSWLAVFAFLPIVLNDPRLYRMTTRNLDPRIDPLNLQALASLVSIFPLCALLGYLTPRLVDESSAGSPIGAGRAYAWNVVGCILGPLLASYLLLPMVGAKFAMVVLALPFGLAFLVSFPSLRNRTRWTTGSLAAVLLMCSLFVSVSYEAPRSLSKQYIVRRDHTATVISDGTGMDKGLSINGVVITIMTPITKFMAHLPLAFHPGKPQSALVICFGMGTTYRSLLSWDIQATAVELVPSVKEAFIYYFDDATTLLGSSKGQIIIDDGRRFLRRTEQMFDVITIDPAPPAEAAGSSLLYSEEFYALVKTRLKPGGILQQWFAVGEEKIQQAVARSLVNSFPYVRAYPSVAGWGHHFLASMSPIQPLSAEELVERLPQPARRDLLEWSNGTDLADYVRPVLSGEISTERLLSSDQRIRITDDRPFNEYFWLRRCGLWRY
jgi:spermidine synthase/MFS family permease